MIRAVVVLLALAALTPEAHAGRDRPSYALTSKTCMLSGTICHLRVSGPSGGVGSVTASVGDEEVAFAWSGSRLHGAAPFAKLPAKEAKAAVTLRDEGGRTVRTYAGVLWTDGSLTLKASGGGGVDLLAAEVVEVAGGYELIVDLGGKGAGDVASGSVAIEGVEKEAAIAWDELEGVWEAKLEAEGPVDVALRVEDADGDVLANTRTSVGAPWDDGGEGIGAVPTDDDPLTTVGLLRGEEGQRIRKARQLTVVSEGWDLDEAPKYAQIDLGDGTSVTIPANSYQRRRQKPDLLFAEWDDLIEDYLVQIDGRRLTIDKADPTLADLSSPLCAEGTCVMLVEEADGYAISVTQYRWDTAFATDSVTVELSGLDAGGKVLFTQKSVAEFDGEVAVVFAQDVTLDGDPVSGALRGRVRLLSADGHTLANGRFSAALTVDDAGDLDLGGVGMDDVAALEPVFSVLIGSEPSPCGDDEGWFAPPPLALPAGNGKGPKPSPPPTTTSDVLILFDMIDASGR